MRATLLSLNASTYQNHALHRGERAWPETNCYADLWIEVLHAFGYDPHASLGFTVAADFEGDQWLFFKQRTSDLTELYDVEIEELNIWRPLEEHVITHLERKRLVMVEVDAFYLPETQGVSYKLQHNKTTIGIETIDTEARTLGYFHNAGYYELGPDDYKALFDANSGKRPDGLAPYTEFARIERGKGRDPEQLAAHARTLLKRYVARMPANNPLASMREAFLKDLTWLANQPQETFHLYAFATLRNCGACYELAAAHMRWLAERGDARLSAAAEAFDTISSQAKTLQFKAARAVVLKRPVDFAPMFDQMEHAYQNAATTLRQWAEI